VGRMGGLCVLVEDVSDAQSRRKLLLCMLIFHILLACKAHGWISHVVVVCASVPAGVLALASHNRRCRCGYMQAAGDGGTGKRREFVGKPSITALCLVWRVQDGACGVACLACTWSVMGLE